MCAMVSTRKVKTGIKKIDKLSYDLDVFNCEFNLLLHDHKVQQKKLKMIAERIGKTISNISAFSDQKKPPNAYNLYFKSQSKKHAKKGTTSGGPSFCKSVSQSWNKLSEDKKWQWYQKVTRAGTPY